MKKFYLFAAAIAVLMLAVAPAMAADKANTIEELAAMYDSSRCKGCHSEIYAMWEKSHHARPLMGVQGLPTHQPLAKPKATAFSPESPDKATMETFPCFKCHLPQAVSSGSDALAADIAKALNEWGDKNKARLATLTINCLVCHNEKAIIHKLQDGEPVKNALYGNRDVASHPDKTFKSVKKSAIFNEAIMCGQCHGLGPNLEFKNPVQCATAYGSYEHNYIPGGGTKTCQECHMKEVTVGKNKFSDHLIAPNFNDVPGLEKILADTITLDVDTLGYQWLRKGGDLRPMVVVNTRITQSAGHRIPDG